MGVLDVLVNAWEPDKRTPKLCIPVRQAVAYSRVSGRIQSININPPDVQ